LVVAGFSLFSRVHNVAHQLIGMLKLSVQFIMGKFQLGPANEPADAPDVAALGDELADKARAVFAARTL
jgi:hypothetical protein